MAMLFVTNLDLNKNELQNARVQNLGSAPSSPVEGQIYYDTGDDTIYFRNASAWVDIGGPGDITAVVAGTGLTGGATSGSATLTLANTAVTAAAYGSVTQVGTFTVDAQGRLTAAANATIAVASTAITDFTEAVQDVAGGMVASNTETGITVTYQDGDGTIDFVNTGVLSLTGTANEVNVDTSTGAVTVGLPDNVTVGGILTVTGNLVVNGTTTTVNSTTMTVDDPILTLGGDAAPSSDDNKDRGVEFRYHTGSAAKIGYFGYDDSTGYFTYIPDASNSSEVFSGTQGTISVLAYNIGANAVLSGTTLGSTIVTSSLTAVGTIASGTWAATDVAVAHGGTGASTAAAARTNLGATTKVTATIGDGSATAIAVTHSLGTDDVQVEVYGASTKETVVCDVDRTSTDVVTLTFASAPASSAYKVVIIG